jgi:DNA repair/transcription protein MET18/MMS19
MVLTLPLTKAVKLNPKFVFGYIQIMDGEQDPRNLLIAFRIIQLICFNLDISKDTEELFDVTFCYFPISFRAPTSAIGVSGDELKDELKYDIYYSILGNALW